METVWIRVGTAHDMVMVRSCSPGSVGHLWLHGWLVGWWPRPRSFGITRVVLGESLLVLLIHLVKYTTRVIMTQFVHALSCTIVFTRVNRHFLNFGGYCKKHASPPRDLSTSSGRYSQHRQDSFVQIRVLSLACQDPLHCDNNGYRLGFLFMQRTRMGF